MHKKDTQKYYQNIIEALSLYQNYKYLERNIYS